jgi:predicted ribosome quality control (RQC) complex YloA/Tae2 family protein
VDLVVVQRLAGELDERLRDQRIEQVWAVPKNDVILAVERRSAPRLWFSGEPDQPHLYLRQGSHPTPQRPPGFAMAARNGLVGRRISEVRALPGERVIELRCAGDTAPRVIFELIPRRATVCILDGDGAIRALWLPRRGRPALGEPYAPPAADTRPALEAVEPATWEHLLALPDEDALVRGLLRSVSGMSPLVARETARRHRDGEELQRAVELEMRRAGQQPTAARIYAPAPLDEMTALPAARRFVLAPYPLAHLEGPDGLRAHLFPSLIDAAAAFYPLRATLTGLQAARDDLATGLDLGIARLQRTFDAVADDAEAAGDADRHRRWADLLLAYPDAPRDGALVTVPDPYAGAEGPTEARIPIDPALSRVDNAQVLYRRARRAERSAERTSLRRKRLAERIAALTALHDQAAEARTLDECFHLVRAAHAQGVKIAGKWRRPECGTHEPAATSEEPEAFPVATRAGHRRTGPAVAGVAAYAASDGSEILVGRSAQGNEKLTHKLAAPHDFWLHAEGPGSHVVIRNPERAERPSDDALREGAALAAWFSRARGATKVNVRWTEARHVKKPRGAPTGQVVLRQSRTVLAEPVAPIELFGDDIEADDER